MPLATARSLLGPDAIIGVSAGNVAEAQEAVAGGADYIGIGAVYPTGSKSNAKLLGVRGVGPILNVLEGTDVKSVVIGESSGLRKADRLTALLLGLKAGYVLSIYYVHSTAPSLPMGSMSTEWPSSARSSLTTIHKRRLRNSLRPCDLFTLQALPPHS